MTTTMAIAALALAMLLGVMLFFSLLVAPLVFRCLEARQAGRLIRAMFPWYYAVLSALSLIAAVILAPARPWLAMVAALVLAGAIFARQWLMPRINAASDASQSGDTSARARFGRLHGASVAVNGVQMLLVVFLLIAVTAL
jgi:hypothetical protein